MKFITQTTETIDITKLSNYIAGTGLEHMLKTRDIYIAGGAVLSTLSNSKINDLDLFFPNEADYWQVSNYFRKEGWSPTFVSDAAVTYTLPDDKKIQLIKYNVGETIESILSTFDFGICQIAISYKDNSLIVPEDFWTLFNNKEIRISSEVLDPIATIYRVCKYVEKGYLFPQTELFRLGILIASIKLDTYQDLINNSTGLMFRDTKDLKHHLEELSGGDLDKHIEKSKIMDIVEKFISSRPLPAAHRELNVSTPGTINQEDIDRINREIAPIARASRHGVNVYPSRVRMRSTEREVPSLLDVVGRPRPRTQAMHRLLDSQRSLHAEMDAANPF